MANVLPSVAVAPAGLVRWFHLMRLQQVIPGDSVGHPGALGLPLCLFGRMKAGGFAAGLCPLMFLMIHDINTTISRLSPLTLGKYRIAANPRLLPGGLFAAQVSIASGSGSSCTARLMRFHNEFTTIEAAADYAMAQGIDWVHDTARQSHRPN